MRIFFVLLIQLITLVSNAQSLVDEFQISHFQKYKSNFDKPISLFHIEKLSEKDLNYVKKNKNIYSIGKNLSIVLDNSFVFTDSAKGVNTKLIKLYSEEADFISICLDSLELGPFANLYFLDSTGKKCLGPYTSSNFHNGKRFFSPFINSSTVILEIDEPLNKRGMQSKLKVVGVSVHPKSYLNTDDECETRGVNCIEGNVWQREKRSVVKIFSFDNFSSSFIGYGGTGVFVNNKCNNGKLYILTAYHVIDHDGDCNYLDDLGEFENSTQIYIGYESPSCSNGIFDYQRVLTGVKVRATCKEYDMALLEVDDYQSASGQNYITDKSQIYLAGWNLNPPITGCCNGVIIHHPLGLPKKISLSEFISDQSQYFSVPSVGPQDFCISPSNVLTQCSCGILAPTYIFKANNKSKLDHGTSGAPLFFTEDEHKVIGIAAGMDENDILNCIQPSYITNQVAVEKLSSLENAVCGIFLEFLNAGDPSFTNCNGIEYMSTVANNSCESNQPGQGTSWNNDGNGNGCEDDHEFTEYETGNYYCARDCNQKYYDWQVYQPMEIDELWPIPDYEVYGMGTFIDPNYQKSMDIGDYNLIGMDNAQTIYTGYNVNIDNFLLAYSSMTIESSPFIIGYESGGYGGTDIYQGGTVQISNTFIPSDGSSFYVNTYRRCYNPVIDTDGFWKLEHVIDEPSSDSTNFIKESFFAMFPNPTNGRFSIIKSESFDYYNIEIVNNHGSVIVKRLGISDLKTDFDLNDFANGLYLIILNPNIGKPDYKKLIISK